MQTMESAKNEALHTLRHEFAKSKDCPKTLLKRMTPEEKAVFNKYKKRGQRRVATGVVMGASAVAAGRMALGKSPMSIFGMAAGGLVGAAVAFRSGHHIRRELVSEMVTLPSDKSPLAARARRILQEKLPNNAYVQELAQEADYSPSAHEPWSKGPGASDSSRKSNTDSSGSN